MPACELRLSCNHWTRCTCTSSSASRYLGTFSSHHPGSHLPPSNISILSTSIANCMIPEYQIKSNINAIESLVAWRRLQQRMLHPHGQERYGRRRIVSLSTNVTPRPVTEKKCLTFLKPSVRRSQKKFVFRRFETLCVPVIK
jgi:hypothetical protein